MLAHSVALGAACVLPWSWLLRSFVALLLIACATWLVFRASVVAGLRVYGSDRLDVVLVNGALARLSVHAQSAVYPQLILLRGHLGDDAKAMSVVLFPDQMSKRHFHLLRVWLRAQVETRRGARETVF